MRKNIQTVLAAWAHGEPCKQGTCSTDGRTVFSYALPVARRQTGPNRIDRITVRSTGPSHTTRTHIQAVRTFAQNNLVRLVETAEL